METTPLPSPVNQATEERPAIIAGLSDGLLAFKILGNIDAFSDYTLVVFVFFGSRLFHRLIYGGRTGNELHAAPLIMRWRFQKPKPKLKHKTNVAVFEGTLCRAPLLGPQKMFHSMRERKRVLWFYHANNKITKKKRLK